MLVLALRDNERIVIATPSGDVTLQLMDHARIAIDAPKAWPITRHAMNKGNNGSAAVSNGRTSARAE